MRYLLDTHSLIWFISGDNQLSTRARQLMDDDSNELFLSIASLWEMAIKYSIGNLFNDEVGEVFGPMDAMRAEMALAEA